MDSIDINFDIYRKQKEVFTSPAREILFGGSAGGGKSHLARIALILYCLQIPELNAYLFRREFGDLVRNHLDGPTGFHALLGPLITAGRVEIVAKEIRFDNGSKIYLSHCQYEKDVFGYQGAEIHFLVIEEATQFSEFMVRYLRTRLRAPKEFKEGVPEHLKEKFPFALYTSNPGGIGHAYFKRAFVDANVPMEIYKAPIDDGGIMRQYVPARLTDNPSLDAEEYANQLRGVGSDAYVKALLNGDWSAVVGSFFPEFDYERHVIKLFKPPAHWFRFRSHDWGSAAPCSTHWWAVSDGSFVEEIGRTLPRGALVAYREWYLCDEKDPSKGKYMRNEEIARGILQYSPDECERRIQTVTDRLPFQDRGGKTIAETYAENGLLLTEGDTSRIPGWSQFRSRLIGNDNGPMIYFMENCIHAIRTIPMMLHDDTEPEDLDSNEDHACDEIRLACMSRAKIKEAPPQPFDTANLKQDITFNQALDKLSRNKQNGVRY